MKQVTILFIFIFWGQSEAAYMQLGAGGITPHFSSHKKNYCNQWNNTSIIVNKSYYLTLGAGNWAITYMQGNDSICSEIAGTFITYMTHPGELVDIGITVGGYEYNVHNWERHEEETPADIDAPSTLLMEVGDMTIVPVLALAVQLHLIRRDTWSLKLNNLFTPIIFNHSLALEMRF